MALKSLQTLVVTMNRKDHSFIFDNNIKTDVVIANQSDHTSYTETVGPDGQNIKMITTDTKGVGKNRNICFLYSNADYLLFADDDIKYDENIKENVIKAFSEFPRADVITFGMRFSKSGVITNTKRPKKERLHIWNSLDYGTPLIAVKRKSIIRKRISFSELFGGGCVYSHGEDTLFLVDCLRKHLKLYSYDFILGTSFKDKSTCFEGYNAKFYYNFGALGREIFGVWAYPYMLYLAIRTKGLSNVSLKEKLHYLKAGYKSYPFAISFENSGNTTSKEDEQN